MVSQTRSPMSKSRREFLRAMGVAAGYAVLPAGAGLLRGATYAPGSADFTTGGNTLKRGGAANASGGTAFALGQGSSPQDSAVDYTVHVAASPVEIAPKRIISTTTYNGQFPGPLLRFKEGQQVTVDISNDTDTPEQLHWHGQMVPVDVDGAAEEGTPFVPPHGKRRISFVPRPSGYRFYHTHNRAGADLAAGQYSGQVGHVYIEPKREPGRYDREVFLALKEFEPT